jgi:hypothetical protein
MLALLTVHGAYVPLPVFHLPLTQRGTGKFTGLKVKLSRTKRREGKRELIAKEKKMPCLVRHADCGGPACKHLGPVWLHLLKFIVRHIKYLDTCIEY